MAQSGHHDRTAPCPLSGVKRTSRVRPVAAAHDPTAKWRVHRSNPDIYDFCASGEQQYIRICLTELIEVVNL
jgi:hypothetical protein